MKNLILFITLTLTLSGLIFAQNREEKFETNFKPQISFSSGSTTVSLSPKFTQTLSEFQFNVGFISSTQIDSNGGILFPISDGKIEANSLRGEIIHKGGLTLERNETLTKLQSYIIDTTITERPVITALISVNGEVAGRIPLFNLRISKFSVNESFSEISLPNVVVTLTSEGAKALNKIYDTDAFVGGSLVGVAKLEGLTFLS